MEIQRIIDQLKETFDGDPWFGRSVTSLLKDVDATNVFEKPNGQHSILQLVWHMSLWREFTISRLEPSDKQLQYFEENDWQQLDHADQNLWPRGLEKLEQTQKQLLQILQRLDDSILDKMVAERDYDFRKLLYGLIQHDIYHIGQVAYLAKMLKRQ